MFISALYLLDYEFVVQSFNIQYAIGICTHDSCDDGMYPPLSVINAYTSTCVV